MWKTLVQPINALLAHPDESSLWVRCEDSELWQEFWNMIAPLRHVMRNRKDRIALFEEPLMHFLPDPVRLGGPDGREQIFWFPGDATLTRVSCINWSKREFICSPVSSIFGPFMPRHQQSIIIADIELLPIINSIAAWGIPGEGIAHIAVTDNANALSWAHRRKAKRGIALELLETFLAWAIQLRLEMVIVYPRTYRNVTADALARHSVAQTEEWAWGKEFTWIELPGVRGEFALR